MTPTARWRALIPCLLLTLVPAQVADAEIKLVGATAIRFSALENEGSAVLQLQTDEKQAGEVRLGVGPLVAATTKEVLPAVIALDPVVLVTEAGTVYEVKVRISGVFFEGDAEAEVLANFTPIGRLTVSRGPFAVAPASTDLVLRRGEATAIEIKNDSRYAYPVRWSLQLGAESYCGTGNCADIAQWGVVTLPAKDAATIAVTPPDGWFKPFTPRAREATLWLALSNELPKKSFKLKTTLEEKMLAEALFILRWLVAGAVLSLLVRHWVPNFQLKRELKEQLRRVRQKIESISGNVSSKLRELLRAECELLDVRRKASWTFMPDYAVLAAQVRTLATALEKRVDLAERIDAVFDVLPAAWQKSPPPTQNDAAESALASATEALRKATADDAELNRIGALIEGARVAAETMIAPANTEFGTQLGERFAQLGADLAVLKSTQSYGDLKKDLGGLFAFIEGQPPAIAPAVYAAIDYDLSSLALCREFIWLHEGSQAADVRSSLDNLRPTLVSYLSHKSWNELRQARLLLKQFRENISVAALWQQIDATDESMDINMEPPVLRPRQLIRFAARFRQPELDWSAARELVLCEWEFPDGRQEQGWTVCHYFTTMRSLGVPSPSPLRRVLARLKSGGTAATTPDPGTGPRAPGRHMMNVKLRFRATGQTPKEVIKAVEYVHGDETERLHLHGELLALLVSIFVPMLTLLAGAREHLGQTTGWLTIFLLGFNSEAIIAVFRQRGGSGS